MKRFTIEKSRIPQWGYEIKGENYHNIAPSVEAAIMYLQDRFGRNVKIKVKGENKK